MAVTRFWGRSLEQVFGLLPSGTVYFREDTAIAVQMSKERLEGIISAKDVCCVISEEDDDPRMTVAEVSLLPKGHTKPITFKNRFGIGYPIHSVYYMYKEGNYSCDCNRSLHIQRYSNHAGFEEWDCGESIELVDLKVTREQVVWKLKKNSGEDHD